MNKIALILTLIGTSFCIHLGLSLNAQTKQADAQDREISQENSRLSRQLDQKQLYKKSRPQTISQAFALFVNEIRVFESYSGTRMDILFTGASQRDNIEEHYVGTEFQSVKGLPLSIRVDKSSSETDMVEVLNDVYLLEQRTDFKVSEISTQDNALLVKGELYGI